MHASSRNHISGNICTTIHAIAEKAADVIKSEYAWAPSQSGRDGGGWSRASHIRLGITGVRVSAYGQKTKVARIHPSRVCDGASLSLASRVATPLLHALTGVFAHVHLGGGPWDEAQSERAGQIPLGIAREELEGQSSIPPFPLSR